MRFALAFLLGFSPLLAQTGGLHGTVTDSVTHQPVKKAVVTLIAPMNPAPNGGNAAPTTRTVTTDASGVFTLDQLPPAAYRLSVRHQNYPQSDAIVQKTVSVKAGENGDTVEIQLTPGAAVTGHVVDEDGDPVDNCVIQASSASSNQNQRLNQTSAAEGGYRLFGLSPGKYRLSATCQAAVFQPRPLSAGPDPPPSFAYPKLYYPAATSPEAAQAIELAPAEERSGIDFKVRPAPVTQIHVYLAGSEWRGRKDLQWQMIPAGDVRDGAARGWRQFDTGRIPFVVDRVFAGSYDLAIQSRAGFGVEEQSLPPLGAVQHLDVRAEPNAAPLETTIQLHPGINLACTLEFEGPNAANTIQPHLIQMQLISEFGGNSAPAEVKEDGTFTFKSLFPGVSELYANTPFAFVKAIWLGSRQLPDNHVDLTSGPQGDLRILLSTNTATVSGAAPPASIVQAVSPEISRFRPARVAQVDQNGQFKITGLAPGTYRVAIQGAETGQDIALQEGETFTVDLSGTH